MTGISYKKRRRIKESWGDRSFSIVLYILLTLLALVTLYPFWNVFVLAVNDPLDTLRGGVYFWPRKFTWNNLLQILQMPSLSRAFVNSVLRTAIGSTVSVICITMFSYVLTYRKFVFRKLLSRMAVISMYVSGGLIPYFFVIRDLGLINHFLVYIIPFMLNAYYVLFTRTFIEQIPEELRESAQIDGANELVVYIRVILPLSLPIIATLVLFTAVDQWNSWFDTYIYTKATDLTTLQYELVKVLSKSTSSIKSYRDLQSQLNAGGAVTSTPQSIRMAITVITTLPILCVYPFVQRYFITGLTLGGVKG
ncbi:MAG: carbohydrate ABC transporter permease [Clostridia bacterium]|nr:carbohydrate ABC transporter permease [Clostridia bacterium]